MFDDSPLELWFRGVFILAMLLSAAVAKRLIDSLAQGLVPQPRPLKMRTLMLIAVSAGLTTWPFSLSPVQRFLLLPVATVLIALALIDWRHGLLPDRLTQPLLWAGLLANQQGCFTSLNEAVTGAAVGYLSLGLLNALYRYRRKTDGIGQGDFKLLAALGAWTGWAALPMLVTGAAMVGLCVAAVAYLRHKPGWHAPLPFGLFLALSGWWSLLATADRDLTPFIKGNSAISAYFIPTAE